VEIGVDDLIRDVGTGDLWVFCRQFKQIISFLKSVL
jgi:hypothetical protein